MTKALGTIGVILAGGRSSRFGSPKWRAELGGVSLLERVTAAQRDVFEEVILVTGDPEPFAGIDIPLVADTAGVAGPLAGIHAALAYAAGKSIALAPCDAPFATAEYYRLLLDWSDDADAVFPCSNGPLGFEPLFGWFAHGALPTLADSIHLPGGAVHRFVESLPRVRYLPREELDRLGGSDYLFMNVNTPSDLRRADALLRSTSQR